MDHLDELLLHEGAVPVVVQGGEDLLRPLRCLFLRVALTLCMFRKIEGNGRKFSHIELRNSVIS